MPMAFSELETLAVVVASSGYVLVGIGGGLHKSRAIAMCMRCCVRLRKWKCPVASLGVRDEGWI